MRRALINFTSDNAFFYILQGQIGNIVQTLFDDGGLSKKVQNGGYDRFRSSHHANKVVKKYCQILEDVSNTHKKWANSYNHLKCQLVVTQKGVKESKILSIEKNANC